MKKGLRWKVILTALVIVFALILAYPPKDKIELGLDLKGGMHLVLQVVTDDALNYETDQAIMSLGEQLRKKDIEHKYGLRVLVLNKFSDIQYLKINLIFICSPTKLHYRHIIYCLKYSRSKIVVEKPTFWFSKMNTRFINLFFSKIDNRVITNLPILDYSRQLKNKFNLKNIKIDNLKFIYHTSGNNKFKNIAVDLLPHAFSFYAFFLNSNFEKQNIKIVNIKSTLKVWIAKFYFEGVLCEIDFRQSKSISNS